jgi:hypothetical protein
MAETSLAPVIVGGLIAMGGVLISGAITLAVKFMQTREDEKQRKRVKFEELVTVLFEYEHWLEVVRDMYLYAEPTAIVPTLPPSPFAKLHAISAVHFPEFDKKNVELEQAGRGYQSWIFAARKKRIAGDKDYAEGYSDAYGKFYKMFIAFRDDLKAYSGRELVK